jgi:hypothetical protein
VTSHLSMSFRERLNVPSLKVSQSDVPSLKVSQMWHPISEHASGGDIVLPDTVRVLCLSYRRERGGCVPQ